MKNKKTTPNEESKKFFEEMSEIEKAKHLAIQKIAIEEEISNMQQGLHRSRSVTVGTAFGGVTELTLRGQGNKFLFALLQPVEVIELIHQLSANIGCHLALKPREDFASWRHWKVSDQQRIHLNGHPPHPNDMAVFQSLGSGFFDEKHAVERLKNDPMHENIPLLNNEKQPVKRKRITNKNVIKEQE